MEKNLLCKQMVLKKLKETNNQLKTGSSTTTPEHYYRDKDCQRGSGCNLVIFNGSLLFRFPRLASPQWYEIQFYRNRGRGTSTFHYGVERGDNTMEYMWLLYKHDMIEVPDFGRQSERGVKASRCPVPLLNTTR